MEVIKQWALGITISAIAGAVVLVLSPQGGTGKMVKTAVSLFLLCAILMPFMKNIDFKNILSESSLSEYKSEETKGIELSIEKQTEEAVKEKVEKLLVDGGIKNAVVNIDISIDADNKMTVDSVSVFAQGKYSDKFAEAEEKIKSELGIEVKIEVE